MLAERGVEIVTFGCRLNTLESEVMRRHARAAALDDTVIVHTCAVTAEAERQARQAIRRLRRQRPGSRIVVTGCGVQAAPAGFAAMPEVDHLLGNAEKLRPAIWAGLARGAPRVQVGDIMAEREVARTPVDGLERRTRALLLVQQGCDHRCTFCSIPFGRGPSRSVPPGEVVAQARALLAGGHVELTVTGVDIASYGRDLPGSPSLGAMLRALLDELPELRAPAAVLARPGGDRSRAARSRRRRAAAAAAPASVGPGRWRPRPQADEAAPRARRRDPARPGTAPAPPRPRVRCRPDRGLPHRGRGHVPGHAGPRRRGRPDLPPRLSLFAAARHAGGADAAAAAGGAQGAGGCGCASMVRGSSTASCTGSWARGSRP